MKVTVIDRKGFFTADMTLPGGRVVRMDGDSIDGARENLKEFLAREREGLSTQIADLDRAIKLLDAPLKPVVWEGNA